MATTKKTTTKKVAKKAGPTTPKRKPINRDSLKKDCSRILKLRDAIYKKYNNRWQNLYGKDQFNKAINALKEAELELGYMY